MTHTLTIKSKAKTEFIDITDDVQRLVRESGVNSGVCFLYVPHTTAGITINEGADPSVKRDILATVNRLIPFDGDYHHREGNSAAHIKSTIVGVSLFLLIEDGHPMLGTWQSVYFCEFDGPRHRRVLVRVT
jgi:secondary thiamine-phosphate synthase enzyme